MDNRTEVISCLLSDGSKVSIEAIRIGDMPISSQPTFAFSEIRDTIKSITKDVAEAILEAKQLVKPDKISIKIGLEVAIESGQLTSLIAKGSGKSNLEITMEWGV